MTVLIETDRSFILTGKAELIDKPEDLTILESASEWGWAEGLLHKNLAYSYLVGKFVTSGQPNLNGHIFDAADLATSHQTVVHAPLNVNHDPERIIGTHVASHLSSPTYNIQPDGSMAPASGDLFTNPHVEVVGVLWKSYFPSTFQEIQSAHKEGKSALSMECVPKSITCSGGPSACGKSFDYRGRVSPSYCDHLNTGSSFKKLNQPHFVGGAVVIPPEEPAWRGAEIMELSSVEEQRIYDEIKQTFTDLDDSRWKSMMETLVSLVRK